MPDATLEPLSYLQADWGFVAILYQDAARKIALDAVLKQRNIIKQEIELAQDRKDRKAKKAFIAELADLPYIHPKRQKIIPVSLLEAEIKGWQKRSQTEPGLDVWISQNVFKQPNRQSKNVLLIRACTVDIDYYKMPAWADYRPEQVAFMLREACDDRGIPSPSHIVFSGQGLQAKWLLQSPLPGKARCRWQRVQRELVARLLDFGADAAATSASQVLRLVGTKNWKPACGPAGAEVRVLDDPGLVHNFEELAGLLPIDREVCRTKTQAIKKSKRKKAKRKYDPRQGTLFVIEGGRSADQYKVKKRGWRWQAWARAKDLKKLAEIRGWNRTSVDVGKQDLFLLHLVAQLALAGVIHPGNWSAEIAEICKTYLPLWSLQEALAVLRTLQSRVENHVAGNWKGRTPIYTYKRDRIVECFEITPAEMKSLQVLIDAETAKERRKEAQKLAVTAKRRAAGAKPRAEYEASRQEQVDAQAQVVQELAAQGLSVRQIAQRTGFSSSKVDRLKRRDLAGLQGVPSCVVSTKWGTHTVGQKRPLVLAMSTSVDFSAVKQIGNDQKTTAPVACEPGGLVAGDAGCGQPQAVHSLGSVPWRGWIRAERCRSG